MQTIGRRFTIGSVKIDTHAKERTLDTRYKALDNAQGVRLLLGDYHALASRRYAGDTAASDILLDMCKALDTAGLTERQREALELVYFEDLTQEEAGKRLGCSKQTVNRLIDVAATKIARVYEFWARHGEGYSLGEKEAE